jgi:hypothetical protein
MFCTWRETQFSTLMMFTSQKPINMGRLASDVALTYVAMTVRLAESLARAGKGLRVFTNDKERLLTLAGAKANLLTPTPLEFDPIFPLHLSFYAAHHKLHIFERFAEETWPNCFLDLDIVLSKDGTVVQQILENPSPMEAWVYDISAQVFPAFSRPVVQRDLAKLGATKAFPLWYGGEFILGTPAFFAQLSAECNSVLPTYLRLCDSLHHIGDETILSVAMNRLGQEFAVGEAGDADLVIRYWTGPTLHVQPGPAALKRCAFWHLPDMKSVLSREILSRTPERLTRAIWVRKLLLSMRPTRG